MKLSMVRTLPSCLAIGAEQTSRRSSQKSGTLFMHLHPDQSWSGCFRGEGSMTTMRAGSGRRRGEPRKPRALLSGQWPNIEARTPSGVLRRGVLRVVNEPIVSEQPASMYSVVTTLVISSVLFFVMWLIGVFWSLMSWLDQRSRHRLPQHQGWGRRHVSPPSFFGERPLSGFIGPRDSTGRDGCDRITEALGGHQAPNPHWPAPL